MSNGNQVLTSDEKQVAGTMNRRTVLLKNYDINIDFWKHHDSMRQEKMKNFLEANTILAAAIGLSISNFFSNAENMSLYLILAFSAVGLVVSITWALIMIRNSDYMRFQRLNLCSIEKSLPEGFNTFSSMNLGFDKQDKVNFYCGQEMIEFKPSRMSISANKIENFMPAIIAVIWSVVIVVSTLSLANVINLS